MGTPIKYNLTIDKLYSSFEPSYSRWKVQAQGMVFIELYKVPQPWFWENMHYDHYYSPPNQYLWMDMQARYVNSIGAARELWIDKEMERDRLEDEADDAIEVRKADTKAKRKRLAEFEKYLKQDKKDKKVRFPNLSL